MRSSVIVTLFVSLLPAAAFAKTCKVDIEGNDQMQFNKKEIKVEADCTEVELTLKHTGKLAKNIMGHNWVLSPTAQKDAVLKAAEKAGAAKDYTPPDSKDVLAKTKLIGGGETTSVKFSTKGLTKGTEYYYMCTFPGHAALMNGKFIVSK